MGAFGTDELVDQLNGPIVALPLADVEVRTGGSRHRLPLLGRIGKKFFLSGCFAGVHQVSFLVVDGRSSSKFREEGRIVARSTTKSSRIGIFARRAEDGLSPLLQSVRLPRRTVEVDDLRFVKRPRIDPQFVDLSVEGRFLHSPTDVQTKIGHIERLASELSVRFDFNAVHVARESPSVERHGDMLPNARRVGESLYLGSRPNSELSGSMESTDEPMVGSRSRLAE